MKRRNFLKSAVAAAQAQREIPQLVTGAEYQKYTREEQLAWLKKYAPQKYVLAGTPEWDKMMDATNPLPPGCRRVTWEEGNEIMKAKGYVLVGPIGGHSRRHVLPNEVPEGWEVVS
jgi:hypothetical protein